MPLCIGSCSGAAKHIHVKSGVHQDLDSLRSACDGLEPVLTSLARDEQKRLVRLHALPPGGDLYIVYVPQLGFLVSTGPPAAPATPPHFATSRRVVLLMAAARLA